MSNVQSSRKLSCSSYTSPQAWPSIANLPCKCVVLVRLRIAKLYWRHPKDSQQSILSRFATWICPKRIIGNYIWHMIQFTRGQVYRYTIHSSVLWHIRSKALGFHRNRQLADWECAGLVTGDVSWFLSKGISCGFRFRGINRLTLITRYM